MSKDELIEDHYGWRWNEGSHNLVEKGLGAVTVGLLGIAALAL